MITPGVGYTFQNSPDGFSLIIDQPTPRKDDRGFTVYEDSTDQGVAILRINAGTFNNVFPTVAGVQVGEQLAYLARPSASCIVMMTIPASEDAGQPFPADVPTITINPGSTMPSETSTQAFVGIAKIVATPVEGSPSPALEITQLVSGSLWGERYECGTELNYWFSSI